MLFWIFCLYVLLNSKHMFNLAGKSELSYLLENNVDCLNTIENKHTVYQMKIELTNH